MTLVAPPLLRKGDTVAVVAPAGPVPLDRLAVGLAVLEKHFHVIVSPDISRREGFVAGSDLRRAEEFNAALRDPQVRAIWAARGGYGCSRIVPMLDADALRRDPKFIIGFSDITVLLCWAASLGVQSVHGPVLTQLGELGLEDQAWVLDLLVSGKAGALLAEGLQSDVQTQARLMGGNMSLLAHLCGTAWAPNYHQTMCILEDVGERPYAIDRYLGQLLLQDPDTGLRAAAAVLLGDFARCDEESDPSQQVIDILGKRLGGAGLHWTRGVPVGHGDRNRAFVFGGQAELAEGQLRLL